MRLLFLTFATLGFLSAPAHAAKEQTVIDIEVLGMVCDFCAQSVWKVFDQYDAVETVDIDLDTGVVSVFLKLGKDLSDEDVNNGILYAGYELVGIKKREITSK